MDGDHSMQEQETLDFYAEKLDRAARDEIEGRTVALKPRRLFLEIQLNQHRSKLLLC
jgi:hypothetical protein